MSHLQEPPFRTLQFYATAPYPCSYLPGRLARSQVATPAHLIDSKVYANLVRSGFRRSGAFTYRPYCDGCRSCIPVRVLAQCFQANRTQQRTWRQHQTLITKVLPLTYQAEHYQLYRRYQATRHSGGDMEQDSHEQYAQFLLDSKVNTRLIEFREPADSTEPGALRMVSVVDFLDDGLSSVYTFYDTSMARASYGTYSILWQIFQCHALGLNHVYLGYWIEGSKKMAYKSRFQPLEAFGPQGWESLEI